MQNSVDKGLAPKWELASQNDYVPQEILNKLNAEFGIAISSGPWFCNPIAISEPKCRFVNQFSLCQPNIAFIVTSSAIDKKLENWLEIDKKTWK